MRASSLESAHAWSGSSFLFEVLRVLHSGQCIAEREQIEYMPWYHGNMDGSLRILWLCFESLCCDGEGSPFFFFSYFRFAQSVAFCLFLFLLPSVVIQHIVFSFIHPFILCTFLSPSWLPSPLLFSALPALTTRAISFCNCRNLAHSSAPFLGL